MPISDQARAHWILNVVRVRQFNERLSEVRVPAALGPQSGRARTGCLDR